MARREPRNLRDPSDGAHEYGAPFRNHSELLVSIRSASLRIVNVAKNQGNIISTQLAYHGNPCSD
jgi:hypothetical protein